MNAFASSEMEGTSSIPCRPGREAACWAQIPLRNLRYIAWTKLAHLVLRQVLQPRQLHQDTVFNEAILAKVGTQAAGLAGVPPINCRNGGQRGQVRHRCSSHSAKPPGRHAKTGAGDGCEVLASAGQGLGCRVGHAAASAHLAMTVLAAVAEERITAAISAESGPRSHASCCCIWTVCTVWTQVWLVLLRTLTLRQVAGTDGLARTRHRFAPLVQRRAYCSRESATCEPIRDGEPSADEEKWMRVSNSALSTLPRTASACQARRAAQARRHPSPRG